MLVPDLTNQRIVNNLAKVFDEFKDVIWNSLPEQYEEAIREDNSVRLKFDLAVVKALANACNQNVDESNIRKKLLNIYEALINILK